VTGEWRGGREDGGWLMAKQAKACFVLPLWEAIAHFTHRHSKPAEAEMGSSAYGNAHASFDVSTNLQVGFLQFLGEKSRQFLQQSFCFFAEESIRRYQKRRRMTTLPEASLKILLLFLTFVGCFLHFVQVFGLV
jgi:hypothetical protein